MRFLGIDPGLTGGIAIIEDDKLIFAEMVPVLSESFIKKGKKATRNIMDLPSIVEILKKYKPDCGALEKVSARSSQGVTSMFRFGTGLGEYRGILSALRIPFIMPTPQAWKKYHDLIGSTDKLPSLELARDLWPEYAPTAFRLKKHDGVAEASLIAKYGFDNRDLFT